MVTQQRSRFAGLRILALCQVLERARVPKSAAQLRDEVNQVMVWEWCDATIHRDLKLMVDHKLVHRKRSGNQVVYQWAGLKALEAVEC